MVSAPYGYKKDPENKKRWLVDEEAAQVAKRIFALCMEGRGPMQIAKLLTAERVLNPTAYKRREYAGCTDNFKTYTVSI